LAVDASSLEELLVKYKEHNHSWIVIAKQDSKERGFKVRCLVPKEEFDIRNTELIPWLRNEIRARNTREGTTDNSRYARLSQSEANAAVSERANDVRILVPQHRSKKTNRRNIVESGRLNPEIVPSRLTKTALLRSREVVEKALEGPIAAIDTRDDLLDAIRDTRLSDPDSWRAVIQNAPLTERKYLGQVQDLLLDLASESRADGAETSSNAFIYNFRTGSCINYDLKTGNDR
jgi:translation initiation factor 2-alpha kinase 4